MNALPNLPRLLDAERAVVEPIAVGPVTRRAFLSERAGGGLGLLPVARGDRRIERLGVLARVDRPLDRVSLGLRLPKGFDLREGLLQRRGVFFRDRDIHLVDVGAERGVRGT